MHGTKDSLVPVAQSEVLRDALQQAGIGVQFKVIKGAGHGFRESDVMGDVIAFLNKTLKIPTTRPARARRPNSILTAQASCLRHTRDRCATPMKGPASSSVPILLTFGGLRASEMVSVQRLTRVCRPDTRLGLQQALPQWLNKSRGPLMLNPARAKSPWYARTCLFLHRRLAASKQTTASAACSGYSRHWARQ